MKFYLHIGTEKTGSSFIQTSFAGAREQLLANGIWYPTAGARESDMLAGRISPGNALPLYRALRREDTAAATEGLENWRKAAAAKGANALLLSNENLIEVLADPAAFAAFLALATRVGLTEVSVLLMLRDPVDQALSLYKHRAKNGGIAPLEAWLSSAYHLSGHLRAFQSVIAAHPDLIQIKRYAKDSAKMLQAFYPEWLNVPPPTDIAHTRVNPSLTLSELMLLNELHARDPLLARQFYARMLAVPQQEKSKDEFLNDQVRQRIASTLAADRSVWSFYNDRLPPTDQLVLPEPSQETEKSSDNRYSFSEAQLAAMADYLVASHRPAAIWQRGVERLKMIYGSLVRRANGPPLPPASGTPPGEENLRSDEAR